MGEPESGDNSGSVGVVDDILKHFGRKGMKWGVRGETSGSKSGSSSTKSSALHNKGTTSKGHALIKRAMGDKTYWKRAAVISGLGVTAVGASLVAPGLVPVYVVGHVGGTTLAVNMVGAASLRVMQIAGYANYANYLHRSSPSRVKHADTSLSSTVQDVYDSMSSIQKDTVAVLVTSHVDKVDVSDDTELLTVWNTMNDDQKTVAYFLAGVAELSDEVAHSDPVENILAHFGRKGMKWGVITETSTGSSSSVLLREGVSSRGQVRIQTTGGSHRPASEDAKVAAINRHTAKASGINSLSNKELKTVIDRMNLTSGFIKATTKPDHPAKAFIKKLLGETGKTELTALSKGSTGPLAKSIDKGLASAYPSKGRHAVKLAATIVSPASGRHRA
jgi:hypothetical protein